MTAFRCDAEKKHVPLECLVRPRSPSQSIGKLYKLAIRSLDDLLQVAKDHLLSQGAAGKNILHFKPLVCAAIFEFICD